MTRSVSLFSLAAVAACLLGATTMSSARADQASDDLVKRGEYLTNAGDCVSCHTGPGAKPLSGGLVMTTPFGSISSPNITPDPETGIGKWSDDQFYRALHEGIGDDGSYLYPAFPFPWYTKVTREDALAIKAYLFAQAPIHAPRTPNHMVFPFNIRSGLLGWRVAFFKAETFKPDPAQSEKVNRGAYLVQGLGHCGECHNANNLFGASAAAGPLQGEQIEGWYAPNITSDGRDGVGGWSEDQLALFLKTGAAPGKGVVLGPMQEVIEASLSKLSDDDLHAIAAYLKSTPPKSSYPNAQLKPGDVASLPGAPVYLSHCASCHQPDGRGISGVIPALSGNGAVLAGGPQDVIRVVLGGLPAAHGLAPMPAVGAAMSDQQVADVTNYVRKAWGNAAPAETGAGEVATLRGQTQTVMAGNLKGGCPPIQNETLASAINSGGVADELKKVNQSNMLERIDAVLPKLKAAASGASTDDIVNALTLAYCPMALADNSVAADLRPIQLGTFSTLVYGQLRDPEARN